MPQVPDQRAMPGRFLWTESNAGLTLPLVHSHFWGFSYEGRGLAMLDMACLNERRIQKRGGVCVPITDSLCCTAETNIML